MARRSGEGCRDSLEPGRPPERAAGLQRAGRVAAAALSGRDLGHRVERNPEGRLRRQVVAFEGLELLRRGHAQAGLARVVHIGCLRLARSLPVPPVLLEASARLGRLGRERGCARPLFVRDARPRLFFFGLRGLDVHFLAFYPVVRMPTGLLEACVVFEDHEAEASSLARIRILHHVAFLHRAELTEIQLELFVAQVLRKAPDENLPLSLSLGFAFRFFAVQRRLHVDLVSRGYRRVLQGVLASQDLVCAFLRRDVDEAEAAGLFCVRPAYCSSRPRTRR